MLKCLQLFFFHNTVQGCFTFGEIFTIQCVKITKHPSKISSVIVFSEMCLKMWSVQILIYAMYAKIE